MSSRFSNITNPSLSTSTSTSSINRNSYKPFHLMNQQKYIPYYLKRSFNSSNTTETSVSNDRKEPQSSTNTNTPTTDNDLSCFQPADFKKKSFDWNWVIEDTGTLHKNDLKTPSDDITVPILVTQEINKLGLKYGIKFEKISNPLIPIECKHIIKFPCYGLSFKSID